MCLTSIAYDVQRGPDECWHRGREFYGGRQLGRSSQLLDEMGSWLDYQIPCCRIPGYEINSPNRTEECTVTLLQSTKNAVSLYRTSCGVQSCSLYCLLRKSGTRPLEQLKACKEVYKLWLGNV